MQPINIQQRRPAGSTKPIVNTNTNPIPTEPTTLPEINISPRTAGSSMTDPSPRSSHDYLLSSGESNDSAPTTPTTDVQVDEIVDKLADLPAVSVNFNGRQRRASTSLISQDGEELRQILGEGETGSQLIQKYCCGGGCCKLTGSISRDPNHTPVIPPGNLAYQSLDLKIGALSMETELTNVVPLPEVTMFFERVEADPTEAPVTPPHPPKFVQPHPPYEVFSAPVYDARELTKPGAEKRTFHFDLDVTDYPDEGGVDFKVGGAIGICPPNADEIVQDILEVLCIPRALRDKPVLLKTTGGRWPTIWGDEQPRELHTTRRELLTWCVDVQSNAPTKHLLRVLAEYATDPNEKKILSYMTASEGQGAFCDLRTGPHVTLAQLLHAFPSSKPPLPSLLSVLRQLMPRFYSLSNDPHVSSSRDGLSGRRLVEVAITVHVTADWRHGSRTGVASGFMQRMAQAVMISKGGASACHNPSQFRVPMFRGLMSNPLSRRFVSDGPMMLIGAGVGMAPFRGFILNRLKNANCANKIWLVQGIRDANLDELYAGELGSHEREIKKVVQSRKKDRRAGEAKYVQEEVVLQADVVWFVINSVDGRVFVCGSTKGMGEGVHEALVEVAMKKGGLSREEAGAFWTRKKEDGQYIAETW